jgi:regulator of sirC expression with transglutaminase-like and TPR domain
MSADASLEAWTAEVDRPDRDISLAGAALALSRIEHPELDAARYLGRLDELAQSTARVRSAASSVERLHGLREYLFEEQGFKGNRSDYFDPRNSFLPDVLDRRVGIPISLSLVLIEVGRRLDLPMEGIGLPGHFITGVRLDDAPILLDPFHGGAILTPEACRELVSKALGKRVRLTEASFAPVGNRQFLARMLANLKGIYWRAEQWEKAVQVSDRLIVLDPKAGTERRDRGVALAKAGQYQQGLADWERYLTEFPDAPDNAEMRGHLRRVRQKLAELN